MADQVRTTRFSVSLPDQLLDELDSRIIKRGYTSRSEFVRDLIRERMVEEKWSSEDEDLVGVLTLVYDHHQRDLTQKLNDIQHGSYVNILCNTHVHLDGGNCLETIIIRGKSGDIEHIANRSSGLRGVRFAKLTRTSTLEI